MTPRYEIETMRNALYGGWRACIWHRDSTGSFMLVLNATGPTRSKARSAALAEFKRLAFEKTERACRNAEEAVTMLEATMTPMPRRRWRPRA